MKVNHTVLNVLLFIAVLAGVTACGHTPAIQEFPDTASASDEVALLDTDMAAATANQVNILSPSNFKEAQESLVDAKKSLAKQQDASGSRKTLRLVAEGRAWLNRSNDFAKLCHANIEDVISARQQAITAGAHNLLTSDFRSADESFREVTLDIEENRLQSAIDNRTALQLQYLDLELRSIKQANLGQARAMITQAMNEGAKEFAPRSLSIAEKSVQDTDAFITASRHDKAQVASRSKATFVSAQHLLKITRSSKAGKKTSSEDMALQMESEQNKVAAKQGQIDDQSNQITDKNIQLVASQNQLATKDTAIQALSEEKSGLQTEQALNARYEAARAQFTESEAQVYKQGNTLMIRLHSLEFPASQAVLKGSNFPLLAKVQKVIGTFGKATVTIEGHTDSVGGKIVNEKLSTDRAQAVKEYLIANSTDTQSIEIKAIGYDYQKPLATNKTPSGRAQNRRVDVLISPEAM